MAKILIIDDDPTFSEFLSKILVKQGHDVVVGCLYVDIMPLSEEHKPEVVFLDVNLPDGNGLEAIWRMGLLPEEPEIIIITGLPEDEGAKLALECGAWDYLCKTDPLTKIQLAANRALKYRAGKIRPDSIVKLVETGIIGNSKAITKCLTIAHRAALATAPILISGETGTGKELLARAIHKNSLHSSKQFVTVDCALLPVNLVESILFGHKKGSFTGAEGSHDGLVKSADGGILFLDEVGELPLETQKKFLRLLQEKTFLPVGASAQESSQFRLIAATNRDLDEEVSKGNFRMDLLHRIRSIEIRMPPLRERKEDIPELVSYYLSCKVEGEKDFSASDDCLDCLMESDWPGNVRELFQVIGSALSNSEGNQVLYSKHLPTYIRLASRMKESKAKADNSVRQASIASFDGKSLQNVRDEVEASYFRYLIQLHSENMSKVASASGLSLQRVYVLMKKYGIPTPARKHQTPPQQEKI